MVTATKVPITNSISIVRETLYVVREDPDFDNPCLDAMILYTVLNLILRMEKNNFNFSGKVRQSLHI